MSSIIVIRDLDAKRVVHRSKSSFVIALNIHLSKNLLDPSTGAENCQQRLFLQLSTTTKKARHGELSGIHFYGF
jgi:hypothetical protein